MGKFFSLLPSGPYLYIGILLDFWKSSGIELLILLDPSNAQLNYAPEYYF